MRRHLQAIALLALCTLMQTTQAQTLTVTDTIFDRQAHEQDFAFGADLSGVPMMESWGTTWLDKNGKAKDIMQIMKEQGINSCRLRVWTVASGGSSKQEVGNMAKRAWEKGMSVMIDFHYSDTWADPGSQTIPSAWTDHSVEALAKNIYDHTYDVLKAIKNAGVTPKWVQVGNETKRGMLYPVGQTNKGGSVAFAKFVQSGYNAVKAVDSTMQVIVHLPDGHDNSLYHSIFDGLKKNGAKWDIIGLSAYPRWSHLDGPTMITKVMANIKDLKVRYNTPCMVVETGHYPNKAIEGNQYIVELMNQMIKDGDLTGCYYWAPETMSGYDMGAWDNTTKRPTVMMDAFLGIKHTVVNWIMKASMKTPEAEMSVSDTAPIRLEAEVKHIRNRNAQVTFFVDGKQKGTVSATPYELEITGLEKGGHQVWAVAKDAAGNQVTTDTVTFFAGESALMNAPQLKNETEKGGTAKWAVNFKESGKYMFQFGFTSTEGIRGVDVKLNGDSITRLYFLRKDNAFMKTDIEVEQTGNALLELSAFHKKGLPVFNSLRVYPLEGQTLPTAGDESLLGISTKPSFGEDEVIEVFSLKGMKLGNMTAKEAGLPTDWDGQPMVLRLSDSAKSLLPAHCVGDMPNIVRKQRLK